MRRLARVLGGALLALALAAVTLEAALQAIALVVWLKHRPPAPAPASGPTVLCVGDSYTFGVGASSPATSYPAQLQPLLQTRLGPDWRVVNGGWPGNSSRDVLEGLPRQLAAARPRLVFVLVGANDGWARPKLITRSELAGRDPRAFHWSWRTGRLVALLHQAAQTALQRLRRPRGRPDRDRLLGTWFHGQSAVRVDPDGQVVFGDRRLSWRLEHGDLVLSDSGREHRYRWNVRGDTLWIASPEDQGLIYTRQPMSAAAAPRPGNALADSAEILEGRGWSALAARDATGAAGFFRRSIAASPQPRPSAHAGLVQAYVQSQQRSAADAELRWLRNRYNATRDDATARALLHGLEMVSEDQEGLAFAERVVRDDPDEPEAWSTIAWQRFQRADTAGAMAAIGRALALTRDSSRDRPLYLQRQAQIVRARDPRLSLTSLVRAFLLGGYAEGFIAGVSVDTRAYPPSLLKQVLDDLALTAAQRDTVTQLYGLATTARTATGTYEVLETHLREVVAVVRDAGAQVVFVSYPFSNPAVEKAQRYAVEATGAGWLFVRPTFDSLLQHHPSSDYFVPDGHLNDAGYAIVARLAADEATRRLPHP